MTKRRSINLYEWVDKHRIFLIMGLSPVIIGIVYLILQSSAEESWGGGHWENWLVVHFKITIATAHFLVFWVRKTIHFVAYGGIGLLLWTYCYLWRIPKSYFAGFGLTAFLAGFDEYLQSTVSFRTGKLTDVLIDISGVLTAYIFFAYFRKRLMRKKLMKSKKNINLVMED